MLTKQKEVNENQTNNYYTLSTKCLPGCPYFDLAMLRKTRCWLFCVLVSSSHIREPIRCKHIQSCKREVDSFTMPVNTGKIQAKDHD